jgi:PIN domain nuclease of toxin-antitoxin system
MARSVKIVLDTCALIWWSLDPDKLSPLSPGSLRSYGTGKKWSSAINSSLGNSH